MIPATAIQIARKPVQIASFSGALITEIVYSYPGLGTLLYNAIVTGDYNLIMGITVFSIVAITTSVLVVDLLYPFFDPRIRYK